MTAPSKQLEEFHTAFGNRRNLPMTFENLDFRWMLIAEEYRELYEEFHSPNPDVRKILKEMSDLLYVLYGAADVFGWDIDRAFNEVHDSNMSKLGDDGKPVRRADGKILKGPHYRPPEFDWISK